MNHPIIASSNANARHQQMIADAANHRRFKAVRASQARPSLIARLLGLFEAPTRSEAIPSTQRSARRAW